MTNSDLQILPGSRAGLFRLRGDRAEADKWAPRLLAAREKLRATTPQADNLLTALLTCASAYQFTPEDVLLAIETAAKDPENALVCFSSVARFFQANGLTSGGGMAPGTSARRFDHGGGC